MTIQSLRAWIRVGTLGCTAMLAAHDALAAPVVRFNATVIGGAGGPFSTSWSQTGAPTATPGVFNVANSSGPYPSGLTGPGNQWAISAWNFNVDNDTSGTGGAVGCKLGCVFTMSNNLPESPSNHLFFSIYINMDVDFGGKCASFFGSGGMSVTYDCAGGAISAIGGPIWNYFIDNTAVASLFLDGYQLGSTGCATQSASSNLQAAQTAPLAAIITNNLGIRLDFDITPGESVVFNGLFGFLGNTWASPSSGTFNTGSNWTTGSSPTPQCYSIFGATTASNSYTVTFPPGITSDTCYVRSQNPIFNLGGNQYSLASLTKIGDLQLASLTLTNGTLSSPTTSVGPFGTLSGNATIVGNINNSGTMHPGMPTGQLTLNGNYTQASSGVLEIALGTSDVSRLSASGNLNLAGTLKVQLLNGADPQSGQSLPILTAGGSLDGQFSGLVLPFIGADRLLMVQYQSPLNPPSSLSGDGSGIVIVIGTPNGNPDFDDPQTFALKGEPTGISGALLGNLPVARDLALSVKAPLPADPGNVLVLLNQGTGTSFNPVVIPVGRVPSGIVSARLAGTKNDDLAVPNKADNNVTVLFNEDNGKFSTVNVAVGIAPSAIISGNFRGATGVPLIDLAVTNQNDNTVTVLRNNGDHTFTTMAPIPVGAQPVSIVAANVISGRQGGPDLVVANSAGNSLTILANFGNSIFAPVATISLGPGAAPVVVDPADVDNDRRIDLIVCNAGSHTIAVVHNLGSGVFAPPVNLPVNGSPVSLASWDMDNDGDIDLVAVVNDDAFGPVTRILRNDSSAGQLAFTLFDPIGVGEHPRLVRGADVTGDKLDDLVAVNVATIPLAGGPPSSSLTIRPNALTTSPPLPGDIDGNGFVNIDDLFAVINSWGPCPQPCPPHGSNCPADIAPTPAGNCFVNIDDLFMVINNWG